MATSGVVGYNQTRDQIIYDAYVDLNAIASGETLDPSDSEAAINMFNKMIKAWQGWGIHLWANTRGTLFLQKNQEKYTLNIDGDHATNSYLTRRLVGTFAIGISTIVLESTDGINIDDNIGIYTQNGYRHWTTVSSIINSTTLTINDPLISIGNTGAIVYIYTKKIFRPLIVNNVQRSLNTGYRPSLNGNGDIYTSSETPIDVVARKDYFNLTNKQDPGTANQVYYDPQLSNGYLYVWQSPQDASNILQFNYSRPLEDVSTASDNVDFPQEWLLVITKYLSYLLAPSQEKDQKQISILKEQFDTLLDLALSFDDEGGSVYLTPNYNRGP